MTLFALALLAAHFIGDWLYQSREMARNKSSDPDVLFKHVSIVSLWIFCATLPFVGFWMAAVGTLANFFLHCVIDWYGWTWYKKKFSHYSIEEHFNNYWFYTTIAIDQFLHLAILFILFL
jgi:Protein of unknown function (DUF3307)